MSQTTSQFLRVAWLVILQRIECICTHPAPMEIFKRRDESLKALNYMVSQGRFERPTFPLGGGCSIQLSYWD